MIKHLHVPLSVWQRWFISGEVPCFTGPHLPLALLAMAVLFLCFLLIPLTIITSLDILKVHTVYIAIFLNGILQQESSVKTTVSFLYRNPDG